MRKMLGANTKELYARLRPSDIGYTDKQYESLRSLLKLITNRHPQIKMDRKHIIGHDEYAPGRKTDPGSLFDWTRIGLSQQADLTPRSRDIRHSNSQN